LKLQLQSDEKSYTTEEVLAHLATLGGH